MTRNPETTEAARALDLLDLVLSHFVFKGHPGKACVRSDWIVEEVIAAWRERSAALRSAVLAVSPAVTGEQCPVCEGVSPVGLSEPILRAHIAHTVSAPPAVTEGERADGWYATRCDFPRCLLTVGHVAEHWPASPAVTAAEDETRCGICDIGLDEPYQPTRTVRTEP